MLRSVLFFFITLQFFLFADPIIKHKVIITGVGQDIASALPQMVSSIENIGRLFADYKVVIYENDSLDNTLDILLSWKEKNSRVTIISEKVSSETLLNVSKTFCCKTGLAFRTEKIARARNIILNYLEMNVSSDYEFIINLDLDFSIPIPITGILDSFSKEDEWDAIFANGVRETIYYWDVFAYRDLKYPFGPEMLTDMLWNKIYSGYPDVAHLWIQFSNSEDLIPVHSAFGGMGIYKRAFLSECRYSGHVTEEVAEWYSEIIKKHPDHPYVNGLNKIRPKKYLKIGDPYRLKKGLDSSRRYPKEIFIGYYFDKQNISNIFFRNNTKSFGIPAICEHVPFHISMIKKHNARLFINPKMLLFYDVEIPYSPKYPL